MNYDSTNPQYYFLPFVQSKRFNFVFGTIVYPFYASWNIILVYESLRKIYLYNKHLVSRLQGDRPGRRRGQVTGLVKVYLTKRRTQSSTQKVILKFFWFSIWMVESCCWSILVVDILFAKYRIRSFVLDASTMLLFKFRFIYFRLRRHTNRFTTLLIVIHNFCNLIRLSWSW